MADENIVNESETNTNTEVVDKPQLSKSEQLAIEQGWVPKEDFHGEEHKWVAADEFLRRGELFSKIDSQKRELNETRKTIAALEQHYFKVQQTEYARALADLKKEKKNALIENDVEAVLEVDEKIEELKDEQLQQARKSAMEAQQAKMTEPHPEFLAWTNRNGWYETNKAMRGFADGIGLEFREQGKSPSEVLRLVAEEVKKKFPEKFYNQKREEASSVEGGTSQKSNSSASKIELTELETQIMKKLVGQGVLTKDAYIADIKKQRERS